MQFDWHKFVEGHEIFSNLVSNVQLEDAVATYGSEIFVADGKSVRYVDLATKDDYIELSISAIDFTIETLLVNQTRTLLVVAGNEGAVAVLIPHGRPLPTRPLKSYILGQAVQMSSKICQVAIHPLCSSGNTVVILSDDSYLRLYDLGLSFDVADTTIDLLTPEERQRFGKNCLGDFENTLPVRFTFGVEGDGWTALSLFLLEEGGDVIVVSPLLPSSCYMSNNAVDRLLDHASVQAGDISGTCLTKISQAIDRGSSNLSGTSFKRPLDWPAPILFGPALFRPAPLEFSLRAVRAESISFLPSQPLNILAISSEGKVDICPLAQPIEFHSKSTFTLTVHESIEVKKTGQTRITSFSNHDGGQTFYLRHNNGLHKISMGNWMKDLNEAFVAGDEALISELAQEGIHSEVKLLLDAEGNHIIGLDVLDTDHGISLLALDLSGSAHIFTIIEPPSALISDTPSTLSQSLEEEAGAADDEIESSDTRPRYQSLLSKPAYRPPQFSRTSKLVIPPSIAHKNIKSDVETLQFLAKYAVQLRRDMEELMNAHISMYRRLILQQKEFTRQRLKVDGIMAGPKEDNQETEERVQAAVTRQNSLEDRFAKLVQTLMRTHSPKVSMAERRYFDELKRIEQLVRGPRGLISRVQGAEAQHRKLKVSLSSSKHESGEEEVDRVKAVESPLRTTQVSRLKGQIECNNDVLEKLRARLDRLCRTTGIRAGTSGA